MVAESKARGHAIRAARLRQAHTQAQLAVAVGVSRPTVGAWERGGPIALRHVRPLALAIGLPMETLTAAPSAE